MKREHIPNPHDVITVYPLFSWLKCEFCGNEYRREKMYQYVAYGRFFNYSCQHCSVSISHCNDQIDYRRQLVMSKRPEAPRGPPPPPPMRTYRSS